jgi:hypothetical protein
LAAIAALAFTSVADAKSCKDAKGHFTKCPAAAAAPAAAPAMAAAQKAARCKDAKGHFTKCPTAAAVPAAPAPTSQMAAASSPSTGKAKHCVKGKACGNSCIKMSDVSHK